MKLDTLRCDLCSLELQEDRALNWLHLDAAGPWAYLWQHSPPWDFCSWQCLASFTAKVRRVRTNG